MWTVGRGCNEIGRRPAGRGRQAGMEGGRQTGRDLEKMKEMVEVEKQVATAQKHRIVPVISESFV